MKRLWAAAAAACLLACAKSARTVEYRDPGGRFALAVPERWPAQGNAGTKQPISVVEFVGSEKPQDEGEILGAVLKVVRLPRKGQPASALSPTDALFARSRPEQIAGREARAFENEYRHKVSSFHGGGAIDMRAAGFVVKTDDAYYIVEYRAERPQFEKHKWALERARATFRLL